MPSPFPGMDPYLEGYLWADVHNALAGKIRQLLVPLLRPRYTARLEVYLVEDTAPEGEIGILYPDVEVLQRQPVEAPASSSSSESAIATTPASLTLPFMQPVEVRIPSIEIRDTAGNTLVTSIEILSPVNKREPGLTAYRRKRLRLHNAGVHLLELDLLRRGTRPFNHPRLPDVPYLITLTRSQSSLVEVWPIALRDQLPVLPIPLRPSDADVALDLGLALTAVYDEAAYDLSIDYEQVPPPPALSEAELAWVQTVVSRLS
jgi:hypothetical protein